MRHERFPQCRELAVPGVAGLDGAFRHEAYRVLDRIEAANRIAEREVILDRQSLSRDAPLVQQGECMSEKRQRFRGLHILRDAIGEALLDAETGGRSWSLDQDRDAVERQRRQRKRLDDASEIAGLEQ